MENYISVALPVLFDEPDQLEARREASYIDRGINSPGGRLRAHKGLIVAYEAVTPHTGSICLSAIGQKQWDGLLLPPEGTLVPNWTFTMRLGTLS